MEWAELQFARAVLQQRLELRRSRAQQALWRHVAHGSDVVRLRSAVLLARAYGVSCEDRRAAEELLRSSEAEARARLPSALASHRRSEGRRLRFAPEARRKRCFGKQLRRQRGSFS